MTIPTWVGRESEQYQPIRLSDPGELLAAVPALLGHYPEQSLILLALGGERGSELVAALRQDLVPDDEGHWRPEGVLEQFVALFNREQCHGVVAVLVDDEAPAHSALHREIAELVSARLDAEGADPTCVYACESIEMDARWWSVGAERRSGRIADPETSPLTLAYVFAGRQIRRNRTEFDELIAPDPQQQAQVWALMLAGAESADLELSLGAARDCGVSYQRRRVKQVLAQIRHVDAGEPLLAVEIAELGIALADHGVRDALVGLAVTVEAVAAEQLWLLLTRTLPDPARADAAVLLSYCAYLRGDGCLASAAVDAALCSAPGHRLASLLAQSVRCGLHPQVVRGIAERAYGAALELGIDLPELADEEDSAARPA